MQQTLSDAGKYFLLVEGDVGNSAAARTFDPRVDHVTVRVTDGRGGEARQTWTVAIGDTNKGNHPPVVNSLYRPIALTIRSR